ncbi:MAG: DUF1569 domain-containing protein [Phycisphaerales bacterium]
MNDPVKNKSDASSTTPERRTLRFESLDEMMRDVDAWAAAGGAGYATTGNWTASQIVQHLADTINGSIDGIPVQGEITNKIDPRMKKMILRRGLQPGFEVSEGMRAWLPKADAELDAAVENLRQAVARLENEKMTAMQPYLDQLTHDEWMQFHLRHAELHLGFVKPA